MTNTDIHLKFSTTPNKLGIHIRGDRMSFHNLYEIISNSRELIDDPHNKTYDSILNFFAYDIRHTFQGDRFVKLDGKKVSKWNDKMYRLFEDEMERFEVGVEFAWPHVFFIIAAWWECYRHYNCPANMYNTICKFTECVKGVLQDTSKRYYKHLLPYLDGAIYGANPYLMHYMEQVSYRYFVLAKCGGTNMDILIDELECAVYGTPGYKSLLSTLQREAKRLNCQIEQLGFDYKDFDDIKL